ncbi:amidophosphoribosyltransferase [Paenibacillus sp. UNCCL117]|uniref:amidophosphoribosyltransferase n=1 Tax=unclassified Paenibacillus TaxID=185978 RepID=UPI000888EA48|nr:MULTISPECIES: amidophosphoribosyltransferase [unclassified Paenibacillus]SDE08620.1 amidophosphoribosyltransferase [Paenibacillus sp. cl123]SFW58914.1 amidophosphoribosyltransferase [Paenibacillus sp. UNCCL117]
MSDELIVGGQGLERETGLDKSPNAEDAAAPRLWSGEYYNEGVYEHDGFFDKPGEECGVFGVFGHSEAASLSYYGLHALQHRGQESAGICATNGETFNYHRGMGLVKEVFDNDTLGTLVGNCSISHVRYSTAGESKLANAQPLVFKYREGDLAIATNGNLTNAPDIKKRLEREGSIFQTTSDTEVVAHLIARSKHDDIVLAVKDALLQVEGAFAFMFLTRDKLIVARDPHGLRPFVAGRLGTARLFASESCAFDAVGAKYERDVEPGELLVLDLKTGGVTHDRFAPIKQRAICAMEYIYFARPDSDIDSTNIHSARKRMGRQLAMEAFVDADIVTGVPDSSISAAIGYAEQTGIPYELGLIKNRYTGRTFIQPSQELREQGVKMKLSAVRSIVEGKRVVMIDDSIVRGTTSLRIVNLLREAGASEVHVRISSPPFANPCFYGIDTPSRKELIAAVKSIEEIRQAINADSLHFLSKDGLSAAIGRPASEYNRGLCTACFDNKYPTPVPDEEALGCGCD